MRKLSDYVKNEISRNASKYAANMVMSHGDGVSAWRAVGKIIFGCGIGWVLLSILPVMYEVPITDYLWMLILAIIQIAAGIAIVVLCNISKSFQKWVEKDYKKSLKEQKIMMEKVKWHGKTLPFTHGDVLALKMISIISVFLICICMLF